MNNLKKVNNDLIKEGFTINLISNEEGFREIMQKIQTRLDGMDNGSMYHYLEELFESDFVYRVNSQNNTIEYFRNSYTMNEDGTVDFGTSPTKVKKETSYPTVNTEERRLKRTNFTNSKSKKKMETNASPCKVDALIKNKAFDFVEEDRSWLQNLSDEQLEKLSVKKETAPAATLEINSGKSGDAAEEGAPTALNGKSLEDAVKEVLSKSDDPQSFIDNFMPEGLRGQMKAGLEMYHANRRKLIDGIVKNSKFTAEMLANWKDPELNALHESLVTEKVDYSIQNGGSPVPTSSHDKEIRAMFNLSEEETK